MKQLDKILSKMTVTPESSSRKEKKLELCHGTENAAKLGKL